MSSPLPYLVRMLLFLAAVAGLGYALHEDLLRVFMNTPILNGVIVGVLVIGLLALAFTWAMAHARILRLNAVRWGRDWKRVGPQWSGRAV